MNETTYDVFNVKLTEEDLAQQLYVILQDDFNATIKQNENKVILSFTNGQTFILNVEEVE
ncbi:MAG: hypothetical protein IJY84_05000 [Clostridia bacterium]|nr:hypothetical protein [Clostridia bacterium]